MHRCFPMTRLRLLQPISVETSVCHAAALSTLSSSGLPSQARVVVCGAGAVGVSVAYQLTEAGWNDVVLLEQNTALGGSTVLSAGLMRHLAPSFLATQVLEYTNQGFDAIIKKGYDIGLHRSGSLSLAKNSERFIDLQRQHSSAVAGGFESEMLSPEEVGKKFSYLHTADLYGALWCAKDGFHNPELTYAAVLDLALLNGAKLIQGCLVTGVNLEKNAVKSVTTNLGTISCEYFVNCAGLWSRDVAKSGFRKVRVPVHPCEHQYLVTYPVFPNDDKEYPIVFDLDERMYMRAHNRGVLCGGFADPPKVAFPVRIPPDFSKKTLPEDWDSFQPLLDRLIQRVPSVHLAEPLKLVNGPEAFTPDGRSVMGESAEVKNYYVVAGMNAKGTAAALGLGRLLADKLTKGSTEFETWEIDPRRFLDMHNNRDFVKARIKEVSSKHNRGMG